MSHPERYEIAPGLNISRALTGLWQVADIERKQGLLDPEMGADNLQPDLIRLIWRITMGQLKLSLVPCCAALNRMATGHSLLPNGAHLPAR